jgi:phage FluMu protein Com
MTRRIDPEHGLAGYRRGCRCPQCRTGNTAYKREIRAQLRARLAADPEIVQHGRASTYINWGCRCPDCREAHSAYHLAGGHNRRYQDKLAVLGLRRDSSFTNPVMRSS